MIETFGWSLAHLVWLGFIGAGALALLLIALRPASAEARSLVSCATLTVLACCSMINVFRLYAADEPPKDTVAAQPAPNLDAKNHQLRYTIEVQQERNNRNVAIPNSPIMPEIPLNGSLVMTARLHNDGNKPVRVYWGDYADPGMYRFEVIHQSGWMPSVTRDGDDGQVPTTGGEKHFVAIAPGQSVSYNILLSTRPGSNCEHCFFRRPGMYTIIPSLHIAAQRSVNQETGEIRKVADAWTGQIQAAPFFIIVKGDEKLLDEGVKVRGQVVDVAGKPVPRALVTARHRVPQGLSGGSIDGTYEVELAQDRSDAEGRFEFFRFPAESPSYELEVQHPQHPTQGAVVFNKAAVGAKARIYDAKVTLQPGRTVRGRVRDSQGLPIPNARLTMYGHHGTRITSTDEDGRFKLTGLPSEDRHVQIWHRGFVGSDFPIPSANDAASKYWIVNLRRKSEQTVSGKAVFANGEPLKHVELTVAAKAIRPPNKFRTVDQTFSTKTDNDGAFNLVLSELVDYDVTSVIAREPGDYGSPRRIWRANLDKLKAPQSGLNLIFDDTRKMTVEVRPVKPLPEGFHITVRCELGNNIDVISKKLLPHLGGIVEFEGLSPAKYSVRVEVEPYRGFKTAVKTIEIGSNADKKDQADENLSRLVFNFPDLRFGSLKGKVVTSEGKPVPGANVGYHSPDGSQSHKTDDGGSFKFKSVPAGRVTLYATLGHSKPANAQAEVREGETAEAQIVLKKSVETPATMTGRILYEDGSPVLGGIIGQFPGRPVAADGTFSAVVDGNFPAIKVRLDNADGWPRFNQDRRLRSRWERNFQESLLVSTPLVPEKTIRREVVLDRTKLGQLTLNWNKPSRHMALSITVTPFKTRQDGASAGKGDANTAAELDEQLQFTRFMFAHLKANEKLIIPDLPQGRRVVRLMLNDARIALVRTVPPEQVDAVITYDPKDDGHLRFKLLDSAGQPKRDTGYSITPAVAEPQKSIFSSGLFALHGRAWHLSDVADVGHSANGTPRNPHLRPDGWYQISDLDPGQYNLAIGDGSHSRTIPVEVKRGETTTLEVRAEDLRSAPARKP